MRYFLKLAYNGTNYFGWQMQANAVTVQEVLTKALSLLLKEEINLMGAGRTDTGVHARGFYAHFDTQTYFDTERKDKPLNPLNGTFENADNQFFPSGAEGDYLKIQHVSKDNFLKRINSFLPGDIVIYDIIPVKNTAHARFDAISRTYHYYVLTKKDPFLDKFAHRVFQALDVEKMNACCEKLTHYTDFTSFSKVHTQTFTNNCKIALAQWKEEKDGLLVFEITADRFLRNMVRAIVGTLLDVGKGKLSVDDFCAIIEQKNRCSAGVSVPAHALFLEKVIYPEDIWKKEGC